MKKLLLIISIIFLIIPALSFAADDKPSIFNGINVWVGAYCDIKPSDTAEKTAEKGSTTTVRKKIGQTEGPSGPCDLCDGIIVAKNVMTYAFQIVFYILFPLFFAWGGIKLMLAQGNPGKVKEARQILTSTIIGLAIAAAAWLIVGILFSLLGGLAGSSGIKPWETITCN